MADCEGIYKMRERIEPLALAESIPNLTAADLAGLEKIQDGIEEAGNIDVFLSLDRALHLATYSGCPIAQLTAAVQRYWNTTQHYRRAFVDIIDDEGRNLISSEHRLIINAVKFAEIADAERYLAAHIRRTRKTLATHPQILSTRPTTWYSRTAAGQGDGEAEEGEGFHRSAPAQWCLTAPVPASKQLWTRGTR